MRAENLDKAGASSETKGVKTARPLALHLFSLTLCVLLPCIIFSIIVIIRNDGIRRSMVYAQAEVAVETVTGTLEAELQRMQHLLQLLATKGSLQSGNFELLHADARAALEGTETYFLVLDEDYNQLLNTRMEYGTPLGKGSSVDALIRSRQTGRIEVSNLFLGRTSGEIVFNIALYQPLDNGGGLNLILTKNARNLIGQESISMIEGWQFAIVDPENKYASGTVDLASGEEFLFPREWIESNADDPSIIARYDGSRYLIAAEKVVQSGWMVVVWAPAGLVEAPVRRAWLLIVTVGAILILISIGAAFGGTLVLARPIRDLAKDAQALGRGELVSAQHSGISEIDFVSVELAAAAQERHRREEHIEFLLNEVAHRAKNQLTVVSSIVRQNLTSEAVSPDVTQALLGRINALSLSLDRLAGSKWHRAGLKALVQSQLESFQAGEVDQITINGSADVEITSDAAQVLGLCLHELATNASKYGALSSRNGRVEIRWQIVPGQGADGDKLVFEWIERDGPAVTPPERTGFGSKIIEDYVQHSLGAKVERRFEPQGMICVMKINLDRILPDPEEYSH